MSFGLSERSVPALRFFYLPFEHIFKIASEISDEIQIFFRFIIAIYVKLYTITDGG